MTAITEGTRDERREPRNTSRRRAAAFPILLVVVAAWTAALAVELTGHASALSHGSLIEGSLPLPVAVVVFVAAWELMIVAMMLPATLPLLNLFATASSRHAHSVWARTMFIAGYLTVWTAFGALAFMGDVCVHRLVESSPSLSAHPRWVATSLLLVAAGAQALPLTKACLRACRHPLGYLLQHYRPGARAAFQLGRAHGFYCLGCCWALMLVMFATGVASVGWMAVLAAVMAYERLGRHGEVVRPAAGLVLAAFALLVATHSSWVPRALVGVG
jgi:predicted metal-binding membrane protein